MLETRSPSDNPSAHEAELHCARGLALLRSGRYAEGFAAMEWRHVHPLAELRAEDVTYRKGQPLSERTLVVRAEQGLGDMIQFLRFLRPVAERGAKVVLECPEKMAELLGSHASVNQVVATAPPLSECPHRVGLMSLPHLLDVGEDDLAAAVPYLTANPVYASRWRRELAPLSGLRVGLAWQGNPCNAQEPGRSAPLRALEPLASTETASFVTLQQGFGSEQVEGWRGVRPLLALGPRLDRNTGAFVETAAVIAALDVVITTDTAIAHLAGALGKPVWTALGAHSDWRWGDAGPCTPWYPTMRLFRQTRPGDWSSVFEEMASELPELSKGRP